VTIFRRELRLLAPHRWWIVAGVLLGFLAIGSSIGLMAVSAWLISRAALISNVADVALAITAVRLLAISRAAFRYLERVVTHRATFRILSDLRVWFFAAVEPLAPGRLEDRRSGDLLSRIAADIDSLEDLYVRVVVPPLVAVLVTAFAALLLGVFDPLLGAGLVVFLVLTGVVLPLCSRWIGRQPSRDLVTIRGELDAVLVDQVQGIADLVAFDQAQRHRQSALDLGAQLDRIGERLAIVRGLGAGLGALLASLAGITLLGIAIPLVTGGQLDGVYLALVPLAAIASFEAVQPLMQSMQLYDSTTAAGARLFELIDASPPVAEPAEPLPAPRAHDVVVRGLDFRYAPDLPMVLDHVELSIPEGGSLGLVGPSGAGKSTIVDLLLRFREFEAGTIAIGGMDIRGCASDEVRAMLGVVPQHIHLFNATIRDNLALGNAFATDEQMVEACRIAQVHDFIETLPAGYATRVGEDGVLLSGGERQRLAIARAVLKDAPILVLDEATANLDVETETRLMDSLAGFMAGRTTIIISHRLEVAARADRVLVLEPPDPDGRAVSSVQPPRIEGHDAR
jgi:ATP-binding cassette, subfamily C, bacterial CydC